MRANQNCALNRKPSTQPRKHSWKVMTLNQRLILESLRALREASVNELSAEADMSRDTAKNVVAALLEQGFIIRTRQKMRLGAGCTPAEYKWSGREFPPSSELIDKRRRVEAERVRVEAPPAIAALVAGIHAMVHAGRASA
jgi:hypothetical protein